MSNKDIVVGETIGTAILTLFGAGVCPARDLGPRLVHTFPPIPNKGPSGWGHAWTPVVGPPAGGTPAGLLSDAAF
ncbi:aquaporin [Streptomyces actuosus]|nr:aquaporin [Streptomyces actuosus]